MATQTIPVLGSATSTSVNADTNGTANTVALRDASGGLTNANVIATGILQTQGKFQGQVSTQTASFTAGAATDYLCDATSGAQTVTLPSASANTGVVYTFTKKDSSGNAITLSGVLGTGTISSQYARVRVFSDGTNWYAA